MEKEKNWEKERIRTEESGRALDKDEKEVDPKDLTKATEGSVIKTNIRTWDEVLRCLEYTHTLSIKNICDLLRADRQTVMECMRGHVDYIYLSGKYGGRTNWLWVASSMLGTEKPLTEHTWFSSSEFFQYFRACITSVTARTIRIPRWILIKDSEVKGYSTEYQAMLNRIQECEAAIWKGTAPQLASELASIKKKRRDSFFAACTEDGKELEKKAVLPSSARSKYDGVEVNLPNLDIQNWETLADYKREEGFGAINEVFFRKVFMDGYLKVETRFPKSNGKSVRKTFYIRPDDVLPDKYGTGFITVPYTEWEKYKDKFLK